MLKPPGPTLSVSPPPAGRALECHPPTALTTLAARSPSPRRSAGLHPRRTALSAISSTPLVVGSWVTPILLAAVSTILDHHVAQHLMPPSLTEWLPEDHLAWFIVDAVEKMDLAPLLAGSGVGPT